MKERKLRKRWSIFLALVLLMSSLLPTGMVMAEEVEVGESGEEPTSTQVLFNEEVMGVEAINDSNEPKEIKDILTSLEYEGIGTVGNEQLKM